MLGSTILTLAGLATIATGFPDGGPVDACVKGRPNQPYHGQARSQPLSTNPYALIASSDSYEPGSQITVRIVGADFKGFFVQARDARNNDWLGSWAQTPNTNAHPECSAVTHADPRDKRQALLVWSAPLNSAGSVYFTAADFKILGLSWFPSVELDGYTTSLHGKEKYMTFARESMEQLNIYLGESTRSRERPPGSPGNIEAQDRAESRRAVAAAARREEDPVVELERNAGGLLTAHQWEGEEDRSSR